MSERERWVIYPLLFLALGAALRDKLFDLTSSKRIVCEQMVVVGDELANNQPPELVHIGEVQGAKLNGHSFGAVEVDGIVRAHGIETDGVLKAHTVYADNFVYRGIQFGPTLRAAPNIAPGDWLRALQQSAEANQEESESDQSVEEAAPAQPQSESAPPDAGETPGPAEGSDDGTSGI
jgi:hypothetical protein